VSKKKQEKAGFIVVSVSAQLRGFVNSKP